MSAKIQTQILRRGFESWELNQVTRLWDSTHEYEVVGRVVRDGELYYVELPKWGDDGYVWERQPRGYLIPKAAFKAIIDRKKRLPE